MRGSWLVVFVSVEKAARACTTGFQYFINPHEEVLHSLNDDCPSQKQQHGDNSYENSDDTISVRSVSNWREAHRVLVRLEEADCTPARQSAP